MELERVLRIPVLSSWNSGKENTMSLRRLIPHGQLLLLASALALAISLLLPAFPISGLATTALAGSCGVSPAGPSPYSGYGGTTSWANMSCDGASSYDLTVCTRKQRNNQPDTNESCTVTWNSRWNAYGEAWQCNATNNYRTRAWAEYNGTFTQVGFGETSWRYLSVSC